MVSECRGGINNAGACLYAATRPNLEFKPRAFSRLGDDRFSRIIRRPGRRERDHSIMSSACRLTTSHDSRLVVVCKIAAVDLSMNNER